MNRKRQTKIFGRLTQMFSSALPACTLMLLTPGAAWSNGIGSSSNDARIAAGYAATPVPLNLRGKDAKQVGIGSYIVNTAGVCNHCHSSSQYTLAGNPYDLSPPYTGRIVHGRATFVIDPTTFEAGAAKFGPLIFSKNLTPSPDSNVAHPLRSTPYYAAGGMDWPTFWNVLHIGTDIDKLHPTCAPDGSGTPPNCVKAPQNGALMQTMPWPAVRRLTDSDLNAVWQYLSAIPCISNTNNVNATFASAHPVLQNTCNPTPLGEYKFYTYRYGFVVPNP